MARSREVAEAGTMSVSPVLRFFHFCIRYCGVGGVRRRRCFSADVCEVSTLDEVDAVERSPCRHSRCKKVIQNIKKKRAIYEEK